ncbi:outer membrane protein OmpA-like peptidoglycan-associated protein [Robbsia andropogonis]|uniref:OmpA/MotB family protein n=1 Tax=Robbsia andropogonis TaxID=28092 RepID=UPI00209E8963|nr:OmpA family protein [Robbsia andropogonis]MCP1117699.1 OmpA family protein [Robbsia andropogonis]MCP1127165.1 OmpA family protein [Robbsia andropogonis]
MADLMTGLMMVFMLLTAAFMLRVERTTTLVVKEYESTKQDLQLALQKEFAKDLKQWNAEILGDMTIRFNDPTVLFATGSSDLRPRFKEVLHEFFPRYVALLTSRQYQNAVKEIRIEGHTSAAWIGSSDEKVAYFKNMELSQARTRTTLEYLLSLSSVQPHEKWLVQHVTANGLSSSHPLIAGDAPAIAQQANQRVEFRIVTNASDKMDLIAKQLQNK